MRGMMLLARVHTLVGHGDFALTMASQARKYFLAHETPAWEIAFAHAIYAHAAHVVGDLENHRTAYQEAQAALATVTGEEDRALIRETLDRVPPP